MIIRKIIIDEEKMAKEISKETNIDLSIVQKVLDAEFKYMIKKKLIKGRWLN